MDTKRKIVIAVTGASGALYAQLLIQKLTTPSIASNIKDVALVFSKNAPDVWKHELGEDSLEDLPFKVYDRNDYFAPFASGSARYDTLIICPCSMGTLGRIANGISDDLTSRAADVMLKERRKLILVLRDTPINLIHINNMKTITEAGGIICPASPSFYSNPQTIEELAGTVVDRILDLAGLDSQSYRWGQ